MFSPQQNDALKADLDRAKVKQRAQSGRQLSYLEGWHVIAEANRIFGFDGWCRETVELRCVSEKEREIGTQRSPGWGVTYIARVRVMVTHDSGSIVREGCGSGHGIDRDLGQAHESALKEAETDAMKRALMTFGNPFGLALYDKDQTHVSDANGSASRQQQAPSSGEADGYVSGAIQYLVKIKNERDLSAWWKAEKPSRERLRLNPDDGPGRKLMDAYVEKKSVLQSDQRMAG